MSLELDARQRAMLQEMGVTVWTPLPPTRAAASAAPVATAAAATSTRPTARADRPVPAPTPAAATTTRRPAPTAPAVATVPAQAAVPAAGPLLHAPVALYPQADPAATPAELGAGWLVLLESPTPGEPLAGDSGRLLDNMLRAMRLHRHPRCFVATLARPQPGLAGQGDAPAAGLQQALATLRPAMVLVLGLGAARAVLGGREPLGRLRASVHALADGTPAIVSYDPSYLLSATEAKAAAWADLCRALALVRHSSGR
ncbi:MAG: hypothetical protein JSR53_07110 [Proteobacteria bacterium]|nr:hypothetical protein [Pseudomonadota bacterium]